MQNGDEQKQESKKRESSRRRESSRQNDADKQGKSGRSSDRDKKADGEAKRSPSRSSNSKSRDEMDREAKRRARSRSHSIDSNDAPARKPSRSSNSKSREEMDREAKRRARSGSRTVDSNDALARKPSRSSNSKSREEMDREAKRRARSGSRSVDSKDALSRSARDRDSKAKHRVRPSQKASAPGIVQEYNDDEGERRRRAKESGSRAGAVPASSSSSRRIREKLDDSQPKEPEISLKPLESEISLKPAPGLTLAGNLVGGDDDAVVATAIDEDAVVEASPATRNKGPQAAPTPASAPETSPTPPPKPFYSKGKFWIAVLLIVAGAGVAIFFATQSNSDTVAPVSDTPPEQTVEETKSPTASPSLLPSSLPSSGPTETLIYQPPSEEDCIAVANGDDLIGQEDFNLQNFIIPMEVILSTSVDGEIVRDALQESIQEILMPELIGCSLATRRVRGRQLVSSPYTVANGKVTAQVDQETACIKSTEASCLSVSINVETYVRGSEKPFDMISLILQVLGPEDSLTSKLSLGPPFMQLFIVTVVPGVITLAPSSVPTAVASNSPTLLPTDSPSTDPTTAPVTFPTTEEPTLLPTLAPIVLATPEPSLTPTLGPTAAPVVDQTPAPTPGPTEGSSLSPSESGSASPSEMDTGMPSSSPSPAPTATPTATPTFEPTFEPTFGPTFEPTFVPTSGPTYGPTKSPTLAPSSNPSFGGTFGNQMTSSTYVMYHKDPDDGADNYVFTSREAARAGCAAIGLDLCPSAAVEGGDICAGGWMTDAIGYYISNPRPGCKLGSPGFVVWDRPEAGAYCCGRPLYLPPNFSYIYNTREEARAACAEEGLDLCHTEQIRGGNTCAYGWLENGWGLYADETIAGPGCGAVGFNVWANSDSPAGAYCCVTY